MYRLTDFVETARLMSDTELAMTLDAAILETNKRNAGKALAGSADPESTTFDAHSLNPGLIVMAKSYSEDNV